MNQCCKETIKMVANAIDSGTVGLSWWFRMMGAARFIRQLAAMVRQSDEKKP